MSGWHLRAWRRFRVCPGVTLNLSKSGISTSFGVRGAHLTVGRRGVRQSVGLPGSGLYLVKQTPYPAAPRQMPYHAPLGAHQAPRPQPRGNSWTGFWLVMAGLAALAVIAALGR